MIARAVTFFREVPWMMVVETTGGRFLSNIVAPNAKLVAIEAGELVHFSCGHFVVNLPPNAHPRRTTYPYTNPPSMWWRKTSIFC